MGLSSEALSKLQSAFDDACADRDKGFPVWLLLQLVGMARSCLLTLRANEALGRKSLCQ